MEKKLKVLIVGGFPQQDSNIYGGIVSACQALLHSSFPERFELILVDSTQRLIPLPSIWIRTWYGIARLLRVLWLIEKQKPDAVIAFASLGLSIVEKSLFMIYARLRGVPSLLLLRGGEFMDQCRGSNIYRQFSRLLLSAPTYLLCQGESWQDFFVTTMGFSRARCPIVKNWTATSDLLTIGKNKNYSTKGELRLLFVGWLDDVKGVWHLLEAFRDLVKLDNIPTLKLSFAGEGTLSAHARQWVDEQKLNDRITFLGWVDGQRKREVFAAADVFVLPTYAEGLPNAMIEAMAAGLPVVVTPVGVIPDVIEDGCEGLLIPPKDTAALYCALENIIRHPSWIERMGKAAFRSAESQFGVEKAVALLSVLIVTACGASKKASS